MQRFLDDSQVRWEVLNQSDRIDAELAWREVYGDAFQGKCRFRQGSKAEHEYNNERCCHYLIVPFSSPVAGLPLGSGIDKNRVLAYECHGPLVALSEFHQLELFVLPIGEAWSMVYTHEDHGYGGPFFIRSEWSVA